MSKVESLNSIIQEAREASEEFDKKYSYWVERRLKAPSHQWLFENLLKALGEDRFKAHLEEQLKQD